MVLALYTDPAFLDPVTCARIRRAMDAGSADDAEVLEDGIERRAEVRRAASIEIDPSVVAEIEQRFDVLRPAIAAFFATPLSGREGAGFLRYHDGGFYTAHRDRADVPAWPDAARRCIAVVAFLNGSRDGGSDGDFDGGTLRVWMDERIVEVTPRAGTVIAFPADLLHEVTMVRGGIRDAIVDWYYEW